MSGCTVTPICADIVAQLARIHLDAFPGSESTALGHRYALALIDWFRRCDGAVALAAMAGGVPAGYVLGVKSNELHRLYRSVLPAVFGCVLTRPWITADRELRQMAWWRGRLLFGLHSRSPQPPSCMTLKTLVVAAPWQSRGVGGRLLAAFMDEARRREARTLTLSVLRTNTRARAFYAQRGWQLSRDSDGKFVDYSVEIASRTCQNELWTGDGECRAQ